MDLHFKVENQKLNRTDNNTLVNLSENYLQLCFTFSEDWNTFTKFALFKHDDATTRIGLVEDRICIPSSLLQTDKIVFSLYGLKTENDIIHRITTNIVRLQLLDSGYTQDVDDPIDDEEIDIVEQIYIAIEETKEYCKEYADEGLSEKVDIDSIVDDLISTDVGKPLSANQGKVLKDLVDTKANAVEVDTALDGKSDKGHKHTKSDITDFAHNHDDRYYTESESDTLFNGKSDVGHTHDERYYTESEVDAIIDGLNNRLSIDADKNIIQTQDKLDIVAYRVKNGVPQANKDIYFYIKEDVNDDSEL